MSSLLDSNILGNAFNISEKIAIKNSLQRIKLNENIKNIEFWGKITAINTDYYILKSCEFGGELIKKDYYYSYDGGITFAKLPNVDNWIIEQCQLINGDFRGYPSYVYPDPNAPNNNTQASDEEESEEDDENSDENSDDEASKKPKKQKEIKRKLSEIERLAYVVSQIEDVTCVVPRGAYVRTPAQIIIPNKDNPGLKTNEATDLSSYLLLREKINRRTAARLRKLGITNTLDFLDCLAEDDAHTWSVRTDSSGRQVILRNLKWLGYEFCLDLNTQSVVKGYVGNGEPNRDLLFMI